ncbi:hypothetical protein CSB45_12470 [candidate division KSB3 bacterium]|uniref:Uncharacterized protein n=1 Tax=candidate division KSB3 bacterium TaxID=2044937 RepID=A0A2G6E276_9BACT|nr:MAG: hypothetical protein CSB45_12470 [candidate division KSB3 bacterium]PIE28709.1 MAG: hypothetical protein CSA57_12450 [candidate division KSB3 bacterium]
MRLVQSRSKDIEHTVEVEGYRFRIEKNLRKLLPHYGSLIVDFRESFFGENFTIRFGRQEFC